MPCAKLATTTRSSGRRISGRGRGSHGGPDEALRPLIERARALAGAPAATSKQWSSGDMCLRWTAAGMLEAEQQFRRVIGYPALAKLAVAVERDVTHQNDHPHAGARGRRLPRLR